MQESLELTALLMWITPHNKLVHYCFNLTFKHITFKTFFEKGKLLEIICSIAGDKPNTECSIL